MTGISGLPVEKKTGKVLTNGLLRGLGDVLSELLPSLLGRHAVFPDDQLRVEPNGLDRPNERNGDDQSLNEPLEQDHCWSSRLLWCLEEVG